MRKRFTHAGCLAVLIVLASLTVDPTSPALAGGPTGIASGQSVRDLHFVRDIRPVLEARCFGCHGPQQQMSGLRLDSKEAGLRGGKSGPVIVLGRGAESLLYRKVAGTAEGPAMPLSGEKLTPEQIDSIRTWIDQGARWPEGLVAEARPAKKHWAYLKPVRPSVPEVNDRAWFRNPIATFVLARLEKESLKPSPEASKENLIRRVTLDLVGLPPSPDDVEAFLADRNPDAYERVVDRLLASPHYGERWARPWLDLARYSDTNGYEKDRRRTAWKWRDWVIAAFDADMPFRQFTIEQIAGDMLADAGPDQRIASGFHPT